METRRVTDRFYALTVVLEKDTRDDDAEKLIKAICMMKGVLNVKGNVSSPQTWFAEERAKHDLIMKLMGVLK